jgi:NACalpha-BTF3-like transcription factor
MVAIVNRETVSVRWLEPFDRVDGAVYRALETTLEEIEGVERVRIRRYSAEVEIADHVVNAHEAANYITNALRDSDSEFQYALRFAVHEVELDVDNVGAVESL